MSGDETFLANPDFIYRNVAGEAILVPTGNTAAHFGGLASLNKTGVFLWGLLGQKRTFRELCKALAEEYELTGEMSSRDVEDFLNASTAKGIVLRC